MSFDKVNPNFIFKLHIIKRFIKKSILWKN